MLRAVALVPPTALLLLPGTPAEYRTVREQARAAVAAVVSCGAGRIVVVAPAYRQWSGPLHPTLSAAGIPDGAAGLGEVVVGVPVEGRPVDEAAVVDDVPAAVAVALVAEAGWGGAVEVVGLAEEDAETLHARGRALAAEDVALLLVGGLSARRGPDAPLAEDPRAAAFDDAVAADLALVGRGPGPEAHGGDEAAARLAALDPALARVLAVSAWGPWQVLLGALGTPGPTLGATVRVSIPAGATYVVATWDAR